MHFMTYRPPTQSARALAAALWDGGDERGDAELAAELSVTTQTLRAYHQKWNRDNGIRSGRKLPNEIVVAILEMRNCAGMTFPAIARAVEEDFGISVSAEHIRKCYYRGVTMGTGKPVDVVVEELPLATFSGVVWMVPETLRGSCDDCRHRTACLSLAPGLTLPCERPLDLEMLA